MANYASIKAAINAAIKTNGNQEITGAVLNTILNAMVTNLGDGYRYAGIVTPESTAPVSDNRIFVLASTAGSYANFGLSVSAGDLALFYYDTAWHKSTIYTHTAQTIQWGDIAGSLASQADLAAALAGKYVKPTSGIPASDLSSAVQTSLDKADTALQAHQSLAAYRTSAAQDVIDNGKQDSLVSGTNIKTVNNQSLLGSGNIEIQGGGSYTAGTGIDISNNTVALNAAAQTSLTKADSAYQKPASGIPETDLAAAVQNKLNNVFLAVYGTTTYADVTAARAAGKIVHAKYGDSYYTLSYGDATMYIFESIISKQELCVRVRSDNTWDNWLNTLVSTEEIASSLSSSSTNSQVAGALAAYNAITAHHDSSKQDALTTQALTYATGQTYTLDANKIYTLDASTAASGDAITLALPATPAVTDIFDIQITCGAVVPTINLPSGISWAGGSAPTFNASKTREINICNGLAVSQEF